MAQNNQPAHEVKFSIENQKVSAFDDKAKDKLKDLSKDYCLGLIKEASDYEKENRESGATATITDNIVLIAARKLKNKSYNSKKNWWKIILKIVSALSLAAIGFFFDTDKFSKDVGSIWLFLGVAVVAIITTTISFVKEV